MQKQKFKMKNILKTADFLARPFLHFAFYF